MFYTRVYIVLYFCASFTHVFSCVNVEKSFLPWSLDCPSDTDPVCFPCPSCVHGSVVGGWNSGHLCLQCFPSPPFLLPSTALLDMIP